MGVTTQYQVAISGTIPRDGAFKFCHDGIRLKFDFQGNFQLKVESQGSGATSLVSTSGGSLGVEVEHKLDRLLDGLSTTGGVNIDMVDLASKVNSNDPRAVARTCLEALSAGVSRSVDLHDYVSLAGDLQVAPDWDLCFFKVSGEATFKFPFPYAGLTATAELKGSAGVRFGPGMRVYAEIVRRFGVPAVERFLISNMPRFAQNSAMFGMLRTLNIWMFAAQAGYDVMRVSQGICRRVYETGYARGQAMKYARAYVYTVYLDVPPMDRNDPVVRRAAEQARRDAHHLGYTLLRRRLEERFGSGRAIPVNHHTGFAAGDAGLEPITDHMGVALGSGEPAGVRY